LLTLWDKRAEDEREQVGMELDNLTRERDETHDRAVISTMHASKGREYESVVLYDYNPDLSKLTPTETEEERRVFYVGATRARESLLATIDSNKPLHSFIRESIAPEKPGERQQIAERKAVLCDDAREAAIDSAQAQERLEQIGNGREQSRLAGEHAAATARLRTLEAQLESLDAWLIGSGLWRRLTGKHARIEAEAERLRAQLAEFIEQMEKRERQIVLLRAAPRRYATPFLEQMAAAEARRNAADHETATLDDRLGQLHVLAIKPASESLSRHGARTRFQRCRQDFQSDHSAV